MPDLVIPEFSPVQAAEAVTQPAIAEVVNDTWALDYQHIRRYKAENIYRFELHTIWALGRMTSEGVWTEAEKEQNRTVVLADMLSSENLTATPEIAAIGPPFFANLAILCKRLGNL